MLALHDLPTGRTAPPEVVAALREIDETAELIYMGDGRWDLLRLRPKNDDRELVASGLLATAYGACQKGRLAEHGWYRALRFARLVRRGYVVFNRYRINGDPDARIVHEFRRAIWEYTHDHNDETINAKWDWRDRAVEEKRRAFGDLYAAKAASRAARNPTTFTMPGLKTA